MVHCPVRVTADDSFDGQRRVASKGSKLRGCQWRGVSDAAGSGCGNGCHRDGDGGGFGWDRYVHRACITRLPQRDPGHEDPGANYDGREQEPAAVVGIALVANSRLPGKISVGFDGETARRWDSMVER